MRSEYWRWFAAAASSAVVLLVVAGIAAGCGQRGIRSCDVDSDCRNDEICARPDGSENSGRCAKRCDSDGDCEREDTTCQPYIDPERDQEEEICLATDTSTSPDSGNRCSSDEDCTGFDAGPAICGINGQCILVDVRHAVRIVDRSPVGESGGDGAEIAAVYLRDASGERVGFGDTVEWCRAEGADTADAPAADAGDTGTVGSGDTGAADATPRDALDTDVGRDDGSPADTRPSDTSLEVGRDAEGRCSSESTIDGSRPELTGDASCIVGPESSATPLGEGGGLLVEFFDGDGERVDIDGSHELVIVEWGDQCDPDDTDTDRYDVELCSTRRDIYDRSSCETVEVNIGGGKFVTSLESVQSDAP